MSSCDKFNNLPQFSGTCWFNAILMCLYYSMCGREIFANTLRKDIPSNEVRKLLEYQTNPNTKIPKPEYILRSLHHFNKGLFQFKENRDDRTPNYQKGGGVLYGVKSFLEYMYRKPFTILSTFSNEQKDTHETFQLMYETEINEWCSNPIKATGARHKKSKYYTKNINQDRPELICINITPYSHAPFIKGQYIAIPNAVFDMKNKICSIDGVDYVQDSIIITNHNYMTGKGHVVAGITCANKRFIYNGWTVASTDPALRKMQMNNSKPCDLFELDWLKHQDDFCISTNKCDLPKVVDGKALDLCFNPKKGYVFCFLYRKDIYDRVKPKIQIQKNPKKEVETKPPRKELKPCKPHQQRDPITNRCKNVKNLPQPPPPPVAPSKEKNFKPCKPHQRRDPVTNRCRNVEPPPPKKTTK
jgi:hypothetical protein